MGMRKKQKILSIEIGFSTIRICEMEQGEKPRIYHFLEIETPQLSISDGVIAPDKIEDIRLAIHKSLKKNKIRTKKAIFTVFSSKIITREVVMPQMKEKQLKQVIEENINDYFPIEVEDYRVTHTKIDTTIDADKTVKNKLLVIAAEKKLIEQYEKLADLCRFTLVDVDFVGNSVYQALKKEPRFEPQMYVKIESENTVLMILEDDRLVLQRSLNYGTGLGSVDESGLRDSVRPIMGTIQRLLHFYSGQSYKPIDKVALLGQGADYVEVFNEIGEGSGITYEKLSFSKENIVLKSVKKNKNKQDTSNTNPADYIAGIGAGISSVKLINYKSSIKRVNYIRASFLMILLYASVIASLTLMVYIPFFDKQQENKALKKEAKLYEEAGTIYDTYVMTSNFYQNFMTGNDMTVHSNDGLTAFLLELEKKLPTDVVVKSFTSDDETVVMQMEVSTKKEAAGTIDTLRNFDSIMSVSVMTVSGDEYILTDEGSNEQTMEKEEEEEKITFMITCLYYPIPALQEEEEEVAVTYEEE